MLVINNKNQSGKSQNLSIPLTSRASEVINISKNLVRLASCSVTALRPATIIHHTIIFYMYAAYDILHWLLASSSLLFNAGSK